MFKSPSGRNLDDMAVRRAFHKALAAGDLPRIRFPGLRLGHRQSKPSGCSLARVQRMQARDKSPCEDRTAVLEVVSDPLGSDDLLSRAYLDGEQVVRVAGREFIRAVSRAGFDGGSVPWFRPRGEESLLVCQERGSIPRS